jgi:hypothetical protein
VQPNIHHVYLLSALNIYLPPQLLKIIMSEEILLDDSGAAKGKTTPTESAHIHARVYMRKRNDPTLAICLTNEPLSAACERANFSMAPE